MGLVSYQEDNQDAAGELVRQEKRKGQVMTIEEMGKLIESDPKTEILKVKNTVIIKADGLAINSAEIESYAFDITFMDGEEQLEPQIELTATARAESGSRGEVSQISTFYDIEEACLLLMELMLAIENQEVVFNVSQRIHSISQRVHGK